MWMISLLRIPSLLFIVSAVESLNFGGFTTVKTEQNIKPTILPSNGIVEYIGNTELDRKPWNPRWFTDQGPSFRNLTSREIFLTRFGLWRQLPWKKINGKVILNVKLGGSLSLDSAARRGGLFSIGQAPDDPLVISSLSDFQNMIQLATHDPRVKGILLQLEGFQCGYAKLEEVKRSIKYFRQSGKEIVAFASTAAEKEGNNLYYHSIHIYLYII